MFLFTDPAGRAVVAATLLGAFIPASPARAVLALAAVAAFPPERAPGAVKSSLARWVLAQAARSGPAGKRQIG